MRLALGLACLGFLCADCGGSTPGTVSVGRAPDAGDKAGSIAKDAGGPRLDGGSGTASGSRDAGGGGFTLSANMSDAETDAPLAGVAICLLASPSTCSTSDANGDFSIAGLGATGAGITGALSGYVTGIWPVTPTGNVNGWTILLRPDARLAKLARSLGTTFGSSAGAIVFAVKDAAGDPLAGVSVASTGGKVAYMNADSGMLDAALTATSADGGGFILDVPPGDTGVTFAIASRTCVRNGPEGWPGKGAQTMTVPAQGGKLTRAAAVCQ